MGLALALRAAVICSVLCASPALAGICPGKPAAALPTTEDKFGQSIIQIGIGGNNRPFILDTGAPVSTVRESIVEEMHLQRSSIPLTARIRRRRPAVSGKHRDRYGDGGSSHAQRRAVLVEPRTHANGEGSVCLIGATLFGRSMSISTTGIT